MNFKTHFFSLDIAISTGEPFGSNVSTVCDGIAEMTAPNTNIVVADGMYIHVHIFN